MGNVCSRPPRRLDGLKVRIIDDPTPVGAELGAALRMLARMMVSSYETHGDREAISHDNRSSSNLTVLPKTAPHHDEDEAA